jgi:hypothetical protein
VGFENISYIFLKKNVSLPIKLKNKMGYSNFKKLKTVVRKFNLDTRMTTLFETIEAVEPSAWLIETLRRSRFSPLTNEKSKAERVVSPILLEVLENYADKISFFSGEDLNIRPEDDLSGECDFFFSLQPPKLYIEAPIASLVESKDEDMEWGIAQCAAQMYGAKLYNEMEGKEINVIYGCATDGIEWRFLKLENGTYYIDHQTITELPKILGTWHHILQSYLKEK